MDLGAGALMLPYFHSVEEIVRFIECVAGRVDVSLLVETAAAAVRLPRIARLAGVHDIHIGLNDLHHLLGLSSHFELLQSRFMRHLTDNCGRLSTRSDSVESAAWMMKACPFPLI